MATASYNTHSPFRRETSTVSARNLDCHRTDCRETEQQHSKRRTTRKPTRIINHEQQPTYLRQGSPERELPRFRKEASILRTETFGSPEMCPPTQRQNHTLPKGSVNHMSLWGDMCEEHRRYFLYRLGLAGGTSTTSDKA